MSHDLHSTPSTLTSFSLFSTSPSLTGSGSRLIASGIHCADSRGLRGDSLTDPEPRTGYEANRTVDNPQKLRISSLYPTTSHCCLRLKILLKALLFASRSRLGRRTNSCSASFTTELGESSVVATWFRKYNHWVRASSVNQLPLFQVVAALRVGVSTRCLCQRR